MSVLLRKGVDYDQNATQLKFEDSGLSKLDTYNLYIKADGSRALTGDWDIGAGRKIQAEAVWARSADGLKLYNAGGNGIFIKNDGYIGIFTSAPGYPVDILVASNYGLRVMSTASLGAGSGGTISLYANNIPTAADQRLGRFVFGILDAPTGNFAESAIVAAFSEETWIHSSNRGTYLRFETVAPGATTRTEKMRLTGAGNLCLGVTSFGSSAVKNLVIGNGTAPTTAPADMVQLWSADINSAAGKAGLHMMAESGTGKLIVAGVLIKTDTGDPSQVHEGLMCINTYDNKLKMYCEGAWRELATW